MTTTAGVVETLEVTTTRGRHERPGRWSRYGADAMIIVGFVAVAVFRIVLLVARHEPTGVDFGNWLMLGDAVFGHRLPGAAHVLYPPVVPVLAVGFTNVFGVLWGSALLSALAGIAPGVGVYVGTRVNGARWSAVAPALLVAAASATGEAVAWGGIPQLLAFGFAALALGAGARLLADRSVRHAILPATALLGVAATSHLVLAQTVAALGVLTLVAGATFRRPSTADTPPTRIFGRGTWGGRNGWIVCAVVVVAPLGVLVPLYLGLAATVGRTVTAASDVGPGIDSFRVFVENLDVVVRDAAWFWRPAILVTALVPLAGISRRVRRDRIWAVTTALVCSVVVEAAVSGEDRLVFIVPTVVGFALVWAIRLLGLRAWPQRFADRARKVAIVAIAASCLLVSLTGLDYFRIQRDFYGRLVPRGTTAGLDWIHDATPPGSMTLVAPIDGAPFGWWVQGYARRPAYVGSDTRWLNFADERTRARQAVAVLSTQDLFDAETVTELQRLGVDYVVIPRAWQGVEDERFTRLEREAPGSVPYSGRALVVVDVAELAGSGSGAEPSS